MALNRLYPPILAGTVPSFYTTATGTTSLVVPFSMNSTVNHNSVMGLKLRLKTASTDLVLANPESRNWNSNTDNLSVTFTLADDLVNQLVKGNFYKIQLAYIDTNNVVGYYSTVAVVKYTDEPTIEIVGLNMQAMTTIGSTKFVGHYANSDISEKVYQYCFTLYDSLGNVLETSGKLLHNVSLDESQAESQDIFSFKYNLTENKLYRVRYEIITNNGLTLSTVGYEISVTSLVGSDLNVLIKPELDYENARIKVFILPLATTELSLSGSFIFSRSSSKDNYSTWEVLQNNKLNLNISMDNPYVFWDYAIESGVQYRYSIQKYSSTYVFSKRVVSLNIQAWFEDIFLYDGERQLKIRYNPTISSFKTVVQDTKKTTLGRQFPFVLRNGVLNYKEFPINGLISYLMDNDSLFISKEELKENWTDADATTNLTDENYLYERKFKMAVLDWLNQPTVKMFKSPQEGNYIVRLTNISLSPNTTVSRLLHSFSCTASEVSEYNIEALENYSLIHTAETNAQKEKVIYVSVNSVYVELANQHPGASDKQLQELMAQEDLTQGLACRKIKFMHNYVGGLDMRDYVYGAVYSWGDYNFAIDKSGTYEIELDTFVTAPLLLLNALSSQYNAGLFELTVEATELDPLDAISASNLQYLYGYGAYGTQEKMSLVSWKQVEKLANGTTKTTTKNGVYSRNILEEFNTLKSTIASIVEIKYATIPVYEIGPQISVEEAWRQLSETSSSKEVLKFGINPKYVLKDQCFLHRPSAGDGEIRYWRYDPKQDKLIPEENYNTKVLFGDTEVDITKLADSNNNTAINFRTSVPTTHDGTIMLRIGNGVAVHIFGMQQISKYAKEETDLLTLSSNELTSYETFCAKRFNFVETSIDDITEEEKNTVFIFNRRTFNKIRFAQAQDYALNQYKIYVPYWPNRSSTPYTEDAIQTAWGLYLTQKNRLGEELNDLVSET